MLERMPTANLADLKPGSQLVVSSTKGAEANKVTANMVDAVVSGGKPEINDTKTYNNKVKIVPSYLLTPVVVDANNWQKALVEILKAIDEAPDAVRDRFTAWQKAKDDPKVTDEARFALAMSGYVVGHDMAVPDLKVAEVLWQAREAARGYLTGAEPSDRSGQAARLEGLPWPAAAGLADPVHRLELLTRIVQLMPPRGGFAKNWFAQHLAARLDSGSDLSPWQSRFSTARRSRGNCPARQWNSCGRSGRR